MKTFFLAFLLLTLSAAANAIPVSLVAHNQITGGALYTLVWKAGAAQGCPGPTYVAPCYNPDNLLWQEAVVAANGVAAAGEAGWDWNPATGVLTATGTLWTTVFIGNNPSGSAVISDKVVDMVIDTTNGLTDAANYACVEGNFLANVGIHGCANLNLGGDSAYNSSMAYNLGGNANCEQRAIGGDDTSTGNPRGLATLPAGAGCDATDGSFPLYTIVTDDTATGGQLILSNGVSLTDPGTIYLTFGPATPEIVVTDSVAPDYDLLVPFGAVVQGSQADQTVTVTNGGGVNLVLGQVGLVDLLIAPFSVQGDTCSNQTLAPGASCSLGVRFEPTSPGTFNDTLDIPSNDGDTPTVTLSVSGEGVPDPFSDSDGDGITDLVETTTADSDGDGTPDYLDTDSDNDGVLDAIEAGETPGVLPDLDADGIPDYADADSQVSGLALARRFSGGAAFVGVSGWPISASGDRVLLGASERAYLVDAVSGSLLHTFENPVEGWVLRLFNNDDMARAYLNGLEILSCGYGEYCQKAFSSRLHGGANELRIEVTNTGGGWTYGYEVTLDGAVFAADQCGTAGVAGCQDNDTTIGIVLDETIAISNFNVQDQFGSSVSIAGDRVLIGAWGDDSTNPESGRAYLFDAVSGNLVHTFENPSPGVDDYFGSAVSVHGDRVLIGASSDDTTGSNSGRAYLFDAVSGDLEHTFENPSPDDSDLFGRAVSVAGDLVLIGAFGDDATGTGSGRAYLFDAVTGSLVYTFENPSPDTGDFFGCAVSVSGGRVLIGASRDDTTGSDSGRAYLFDGITGGLVRTIENPSPWADARFGEALSVSGNRLVVGTPSTAVEFSEGYPFEWVSRSAYLFDAVTGSLVDTIENPSRIPGNSFGAAVSVSGGRVLIGAPPQDFGSGRAYLYDVDFDDDGVANVVEGTTADTDGDGIPDYLQQDSDANGISDASEAGDVTNPVDTDGDGWFDFQDPDNDGDGVADTIELGPDPGNPYDWDLDGIPDYIDADSQGGVGGGDTQADPVMFIAQPDVPLGAYVMSNTVTITGINEPAPISAVGGYYSRGCTGGWKSSGWVIQGDIVCVRQYSGAVFSTTRDMTLSVGEPAVAAVFSITTTADNEPDPISFVDQSNVTLGEWITSNVVTITGVDEPVPISVTSGQYSIGCTTGFLSLPGIISNGQTVCVRHLSTGGDSTLLKVGNVHDVFSTTTGSTLDTLPDPFDFGGVFSSPNGTASGCQVITGINVPVDIRLYSGVIDSRYWVDAGEVTREPGLISAGQTACVAHTLGAGWCQNNSTELAIGDAVGSLTSEVQCRNEAVADTTPEVFIFGDQVGVAPSLMVTSTLVPISGFDGQLLISIPNVYGEYSIGCTGNFVSTSQYIESGLSVCVRHISAPGLGEERHTQLKVGSVWSTFTSATWAAAPAADSDADGIPDAQDNCINAANGPLIPDAGGNNQWDADGDGYGNRCDGDLNNNGFTNAQDYVLFRAQLGQPSVYPAFKSADINGNGFANAQDYVLFRQLLGSPPGPSGVAP